MSETEPGRAPLPGAPSPTDPSTYGTGCLAVAMGIALAIIAAMMAFVFWSKAPDAPGSSPSAAAVVSAAPASAAPAPSAAPASAIASAAPSVPPSVAPSVPPSAAPTSVAAQATSVAPVGSGGSTARPSIVPQLMAPRGFTVLPDPAGGALVKWAQLSLGIDPVTFSVRVGATEAASVPFVAGVVDYQVRLPDACGSIDVVVVAVGASNAAPTAPFHVDLPACP